MRVLLVSHGLPPWSVAGTETYTLSLARALRAHHEVAVFTTRADGGPDLSLQSAETDGVPVDFVVNRLDGWDMLMEARQPPVEERFREVLRRRAPDVIHFQHEIKLSAGLVDVARAEGRPALLTLHDYWFACPHVTLLRRDLRVCDLPGRLSACVRCDFATAFLNGIEREDYVVGMPEELLSASDAARLRALYDGFGDGTPPPGVDAGEAERFAARRALIQSFLLDRLIRFDLLVSPSRFLAERFQELGVPAGRLRVVPNGIELGGLRPGPAPEGPPRFVFLGTFNKHKGLHVLVEAMNRLEPGAAFLDVHGDSSDRKYREWVRALARHPGIVFHGGYDQARLPELLRVATAVVVPSVWFENYPIAIREAFAAGVPVVASDLGALPESVKDGVDGLLFQPGDAEDLARVLRRFVDEPELGAALRRGIAKVKSIAEAAAELERLYAEVGARPRPSEPPVPETGGTGLLAGLERRAREGVRERLGHPPRIAVPVVRPGSPAAWVEARHALRELVPASELVDLPEERQPARRSWLPFRRRPAPGVEPEPPLVTLPPREDHAPPAPGRHLLFVGPLGERSGLAEALWAWVRLSLRRGERPRMEAVTGPGGPFRAEVERMLRRLEPDHPLRLHEDVGPEQAPALIEGAAVVALAGPIAGIEWVAARAVLAERPVVAAEGLVLPAPFDRWCTRADFTREVGLLAALEAALAAHHPDVAAGRARALALLGVG
jgi:glycosyltransferase involved in cell wall biosynthesis